MYAIARTIPQQHHRAENDRRDKADQRPRVEVETEKRRPIRSRARRDVREHLARRCKSAADRTQDRHAVMRGCEAEANIQQEADSAGDESRALQIAQRTRQLIESELPCEREQQREAHAE